MRDITVVILAGGRSSRMGIDKRFLLMPDGRSLLKIALDKAKRISTRVLLSTGADDYHSGIRGLLVVQDQLSGYGPIGGLISSLEEMETKKAIVMPCDVPFVPVALLNHLVRLSHRNDIVVPVAGRTQPLTALYSKSVVPVLKEAATRHTLSLHSVLGQKRLRVVRVGLRELRQFGDPNMMFFNINTPRDLERARKMMKGVAWRAKCTVYS